MGIKRKFPAKTATVQRGGGYRAKKDDSGALLCVYGCIGCGACAVACPRRVIHDRFGILTEKR